jgi:L-arabinonolactonase
MQPIDIIPAGNMLGEGVSWHDETQTLWWTDIQARRLYRYDLKRRAMETLATPERLTSFGFVAGSGKLIAAFESGIGLYEPGSSEITWLHRPRFEVSGLRFNDGRTDRQGRFWTGTMVEGGAGAPAGSLHSMDKTGIIATHASGISISNGICWSPDGRLFYFADSPARTIFVYDFDSDSGTISNRRVFARTPEGAYPDGANVDAQGFLWSAHWGGSKVVRFAPDGTVDMTIEVPTEQPTCVAFGGQGLDLLFVTSARDGLTPDALATQPHAGDVFVYKVSVPGLPDGRFIL